VGTEHLLKLKRFEAIPIVRLVDFLTLFPKNGQTA
jgi:hypothetical protein